MFIDLPIIGAILTIFTILISIIGLMYKWYQTLYRIKVTSSTLIPGYLIPGKDGLTAGKPMIAIDAKNVGERIVTLSSWGFLLPNKTYITQDPRLIPVRFPYELLPGKSVTVSMEYYELAKNIKQAGYNGEIIIYGFFRDQLDHKFSSKKIVFDIESYLKEKNQG